MSAAAAKWLEKELRRAHPDWSIRAALTAVLEERERLRGFVRFVQNRVERGISLDFTRGTAAAEQLSLALSPRKAPRVKR